jgi:hypothetical protein
MKPPNRAFELNGGTELTIARPRQAMATQGVCSHAG